MNSEGFVLIGGASSRMGRDKAQMTIGGQKMYELAVAALRNVCLDNVTLVGNSSVNCHELPVLADAGLDMISTRAPIVGVYSAIANAKTQWIAILACDLPFVTGDLIAKLAGYCSNEFDAVVPLQPDGLPQPLCAFYRRERCLPVIRDMIGKAELKMQNLLGLINTRFIPFDEIAGLDGSANFFLNINKMEDYQTAQKIFADERTDIQNA